MRKKGWSDSSIGTLQALTGRKQRVAGRRLKVAFGGEAGVKKETARAILEMLGETGFKGNAKAKATGTDVRARSET